MQNSYDEYDDDDEPHPSRDVCIRTHIHVYVCAVPNWFVLSIIGAHYPSPFYV